MRSLRREQYFRTMPQSVIPHPQYDFYHKINYIVAPRYANDLITDLSALQSEQLVEEGYLHSTLVGFNAQYKQYIVSEKLSQQIVKLRNKARADLRRAIEELAKRSTPDMVKITWGQYDPTLPASFAKSNMPNLDQYEVAYYILNNTVGGKTLKQYINAYDAFRISLEQLGKTGDLYRIVNAPVELKSQIQQLRDAVIRLHNISQQYMKIAKQYGLETGAGAQDKYDNALQKVIALTQDSNMKIAELRGAMKTIAQYFGHRAEEMRTVDIFNTNPTTLPQQIQQGRMYDMKLVNVGKDLADATFSVDVPVEKDKTETIRVGISIKNRTQDHFSISAHFAIKAKDPKDLKDDHGVRFFKQLIYVYRNVLGLTTFARDKKETKRGHEARFSMLLSSLDAKTQQALKTFREFAVARALLTAFFGNTDDNTESKNLIDPHYFEKLQKIYNTEGTKKAPPVYVITAKHVYRTADILSHYIDLKNFNKLTKESESDYGFELTQKELRDLWQRKRVVLLHGAYHDSVYNLILDDIDDIMRTASSKKKRRNLFSLTINRILLL